MRDVTRTRGERGLSTVELTMALPLVLFALLMLIGMGHALISKQHAVVGGQVAAHHQRVREAAPNAAAIGRGVTGGAETFRLNGGGEETISYTARATPRKGLIAQRYPLNAESQYHTPRVDNACVPNCRPFDSFARLLSPELITGIIFSGNAGGLSGGDLLSTISEKGNKKRKELPPGVNVTTPVEAAIAGGGIPPGGSGRTGGNSGTPPGGAGGGMKPPGGSGNTVGETDATRIGKDVHKRKADERRASGEYDAVNSPITDKSGNPILVPRRVDRRTGEPQPGTRSQEAIPDAVNYKDGVIIDDKPMGRPIAKDRQEIIRFIEAYRQREGVNPKRIEIHRYDPNTGELVGIEIYKSEDFLPGNNK